MEEKSMKWFWFITHIQLPISCFIFGISVLGAIGYAFGGKWFGLWETIFTIIFAIVSFVALLGLADRKQYGLTAYICFLTLPIIYGTGKAILFSYTPAEYISALISITLSVVTLILNCIYFDKRKEYFT